MLSPDIKEKIKLDNDINTVFAPQLVGLVTTLDRASQPNMAALAWIMSTSHYAGFMAVSVSEARYAYECVNCEFVTNLPTKELVEQDRPLEPCWGDKWKSFKSLG